VRHVVKSVITVRHIFISSGHNFFGHYGQPPGTHRSVDAPQVQCRAGWGLEGDRFYGYRPGYNGQITFFAWEVYVAAKKHFAVPDLKPDAFRRNVLVEDTPLRDLIGTRFTLGGVEFEGMSEAKPCSWMETAIAPGAEKWLRGNGGLRAKILSDGQLRCGSADLQAHGLLALS